MAYVLHQPPISQVVEQGLLTEGVLLAGFTILEKVKEQQQRLAWPSSAWHAIHKCRSHSSDYGALQARQENEDPRTIASLAKTCERLTEILTVRWGAIRPDALRCHLGITF